MTDIEQTAVAVANAKWQDRVALIRKIPERFGLAQHADVYAAIAARVYVPHLVPDFGFVHWRKEYELAAVEAAYGDAYRLTEGFTKTDVATLSATIEKAPASLRVFRLLLGFTPQEFAVCCEIVASREKLTQVGASRIKSMEEGAPTKSAVASTARGARIQIRTLPRPQAS